MKNTLTRILGAAFSSSYASARLQWPFRPSPANMALTAICATWPSQNSTTSASVSATTAIRSRASRDTRKPPSRMRSRSPCEQRPDIAFTVPAGKRLPVLTSTDWTCWLRASFTRTSHSFLSTRRASTNQPPILPDPATGTILLSLAAIESANVVFSNLVQDKLNLRVGRFEPGFQLLSSRRLYYVLQPLRNLQFQRHRRTVSIFQQTRSELKPPGGSSPA